MNISVLPFEIAIILFIVLVVVLVVQFYIKIHKNKTNIKGNKQEVSGIGNISINGVQGDVSITNSPELNGCSDSDIDYNTNILFIDDEQNENDFQLIRLLNSNGFLNTHLVNDATVIQAEVLAAKIIFVDITGVGKKAGCNEGTELAVLIKRRYNNKAVAIYSSTETHNIQVKGLKELDNIFGKNDDFQLYLDFITEHARRN